mmetsp:Transcript_13374/g.28033  ORF Transcript_13374/g.28033 Transcript_13374/m.28033 type:complete len:566 (-) Transcript_13374:28-1725(-)
MATTMQPNLRFLRVSTLLLFILSSRETEARAASSLVSAAAAATTPEATTIKSDNNIVSPSRDTLSSSTPPSPSFSPANLDQPFEPSFNLQDVMKSRRTVSRKEQLVQQFLIDMKKIQSLPVTKLTTPCHLVCKDTSNTKTWNLEDWDRRECIFFSFSVFKRNSTSFSHDYIPSISNQMGNNGQTRNEKNETIKYIADCATSLKRYTRHILSWPKSSTSRSVLPTVAVVTAWSVLILLGSNSSDSHPVISHWISKASISSGLISTFLSPIALLLSLRANQAMNRLMEVRKAWGLMGRSIRSLAGLVATYGVLAVSSPMEEINNPDDKNNDDDKDNTQALEMVATSLLVGRYLAIFGWCMKAAFRRDEDESEIIRAALPKEEAEWLLFGANGIGRPVAILSRLRCLILRLATLSYSSSSSHYEIHTRVEETRKQQMQQHQQHNFMLSPLIHLALEERLYDLEQAFGICNRILMSPIPPTYTRHTSRVLCLFLFLLPLALAGMNNMAPLALLLSVSTTTYVLVGIDEIGLEIEHPFPLLPMQGMALAFQRNVENQFLLVGGMPRVRSK